MLLSLLLACTPDDKDALSPIGSGDGSRDSVTWTTVLDEGDDVTDPRDFGFDEEGRLWVANREDDATFIVTDPGTANQDVERRVDGYAMHFMEEVAAVSFDGNGQWGSCGETRNTYNGQSRPNDFMGPVLWTTNLDIFAVADPMGLGSHLDMQHESPNCVGITWESDNAYWIFDGKNKNIVRNDFQGDHGPGFDDHSDGIIQRLVEPEVLFEKDAPGHMAYDHETGLLYVADTGNDRVLWIDTTTGEKGENLPVTEPGTKHYEWNGAEWGVLIDGIDKPGGLALHGERLYVGEWATGVIYEFDLEGTELRSLETGVGAEALYGLHIGPDGKMWVSETATPAVLRIDPE